MESIQVPVVVDVANIDWPRIELFRRRSATLWDNFKDLKLGQPHGSFAKQDDGSYEGGFDLPNEYRLKGFYVDFRHFYLDDEPTNINSVANYLSSLTDSAEYHRFIKDEKSNLKSEFIESGWFQYKGKSFTTKQVLDIWFNAEIFHNDRNKMSVALDWMEILSTKTARTMLFMAVYDSILIIRNINWSLKELSKTNLNLRMPNNRLVRTPETARPVS